MHFWISVTDFQPHGNTKDSHCQFFSIYIMQVLNWLLLVCGFCFNPLNSPILSILLLSPSYSWEAGTGKDKGTCPRSQRKAEGRCGHEPRFATHPFIGAHAPSCFCGHCHQTKEYSKLVFPAQYWRQVWSSKFLYLNEFLSKLSPLFQKRKTLLRYNGCMRFPGGSSTNAEEPTPVFLLEKSHGQRSLVGYSPQAQKSWAQLSLHT